MTANRRVFYATQKAGLAPVGSTTYTSLRGVQSIGVTSSFNLEAVFELGQVSIYENIETIPSVEVTAQKVLDGYCPIYVLATQSASYPTLISRGAANPCSVVLAIYSDQQNAASGTAITAAVMSGLYVNSVAYRVTVDSNATEDVTFVGNNKLWSTTNPTINDTTGPGGAILSNNNDTPMAIGGSGGVNRREDFMLGTVVGNSRLPSEIPGTTSSGYIAIGADGSYGVHMTSFSASANFGREDMFELGRKGTYYKFPRTPIEVTIEIGVHSTSGDMISFSEEGIYSEGGCGSYNLTDQTIFLRMCEGLRIDLGSSNKLQTIGLTGGDTRGANQAITYTYRNYNDMTVYHPQDPNMATADFIPPAGW